MPSAIEQTVETIIATQRRAIASQKFDVIGPAVQMQVDGKGLMNFGRMAPVIGSSIPETYGGAVALLLLGDWNGLPDLFEPALNAQKQAKPCKRCLVPCDLCPDPKTKKPAGTRPCNFTGCGGRGTIIADNRACKACKGKGRVKGRSCKPCGGAGVVPNHQPCPGCKGEKVVTCPGCLGTKQMSSGGIDDRGKGSTARDSKECPACRGQKHELKITPQPWQNFVQGRLGSRLVFGPISRIVYRDPNDPKMKNRIKVIEINPDAEDRRMTLLLDSPEPGSRGYFVGGTWNC